MKKLLLPVDGTKRGAQTVDWVIENYKAEDVSVTLMMVVDSKQEFEVKETYKESAQEYMMTTLKKEAKQLIEKGYAVEYKTDYGAPGEQIVRYAKKENFDAIIMTKSTKDGWLSTIGSVTANVVKYASNLVMIIPEKQ
jgi:nucleotide-binding universal stress UspA family protein